MNEVKSTLLYKRLNKLNKPFASKVLENTNNIVELINKKTTINFPNYTNHDITHSINIINTMYELIKDKIKEFNELELAFMIYSAVYHDVGMALDDDEIDKIKDNTSKYLYGKDFESIKTNFYDDEFLAIQETIRVSHGKIANELICTKYKESFKVPNTNIYFTEDLGKICEAHTRDKNYLESIKEQRTKGDYEYNARFIAILLRVSDILDIDSTRTPLELYNAMNLSAYSDGEWHKNFTIENTKKIFKKNKLKEIRLEGSCSDIKIHRKLLEYIKWIENELKLAVTETSDMKEKYHLELNTQVKNSIESKGYTIPDLKLNMDYQAVTNLLMGESLYGSKDKGLRELIQNSIDACMVKKEKLDNENPNNKYEPTIDINIDEVNNQVIIEDNGMGMNEHIIKNYFLNVGKSYYKSKDFLDYKHEYSPIGNFGIGFLSCFMLSPEVKVITKYYGESKKYEIDVEQNSEYISFNEEDESIWESGTKISLNSDSFENVVMQYSYFRTLEEGIVYFLDKNILIEGFSIRFNGIEIKQKLNIVKSDYIIDLYKYSKTLSGTISLNYSKKETKLEKYMSNSILSIYCDGRNMTKINDIDDLKISELLEENCLHYYRIPLLNESAYSDYITLIQTDSIYGDDAIQSLEDNGVIDKYICLFLSKETLINDSYSEDDFIYWFENEHDYEEIEIFIGDILTKMDLELDYEVQIPELIYENEYILLSGSCNRLFFQNIYKQEMADIYLKNIKLSHELHNFLIQNWSISKIRINIIDSYVQSDITRKSLLNDSKDLLNKTLFRIIHEYILNNFKLTSDEKILIQKFIEEFYPIPSTLLK